MMGRSSRRAIVPVSDDSTMGAEQSIQGISIQGIEASGVARLPRTPAEAVEASYSAGTSSSSHAAASAVASTACAPPPPSEPNGLVWFWQRLTQQSAKEYDVLAQSETAAASTSNLKSSPIPIPHSPLRTARSFDSQSHSVPSIHSDEIVLPGSLLQQKMAQKMCETLEEQGDECVICLEGFSDTNPRMPTHCGCGDNKTFFHLPCLYQWMDQDPNCPSCRNKLHWDEF
eukprot:CAMPEP_0194033584 /NCGR_PEP_ID=MMETSP0009_2-20130614/6221_1 /TAXON_ID=210454 /ORGANISM="Grammatophora oceanica, Strain CCMP 410" /LENGTH=228 /DNA_ID=CAMNT_0038674299 /DNA_START=267 /DNA_END=953 /DNA_ORIENTATION=+